MKLIQEIWIQSCIAAKINNGSRPDNVMVHPITLARMDAESAMELNRSSTGKYRPCFGMKIIETTAVQIDEILVTYNGNKRIDPHS